MILKERGLIYRCGLCSRTCTTDYCSCMTECEVNVSGNIMLQNRLKAIDLRSLFHSDCFCETSYYFLVTADLVPRVLRVWLDPHDRKYVNIQLIRPVQSKRCGINHTISIHRKASISHLKQSACLNRWGCLFISLEVSRCIYGTRALEIAQRWEDSCADILKPEIICLLIYILNYQMH